MECRKRGDYSVHVKGSGLIYIIVVTRPTDGKELLRSGWKKTTYKITTNTGDLLLVYEKQVTNGTFYINSTGNWAYMLATKIPMKIIPSMSCVSTSVDQTAPPLIPMTGVDLSKSAKIDWPAHTHIISVTNGTFKGFSLYSRRYTKHHAAPSFGMTDFTVTKSGIVYIRANFYRNNYSGGQWKKDVRELEDFAKRGWNQIGQTGNWRYFSKHCEKGERYRIRVWKYQNVDIFAPAPKVTDSIVPVYTWTGEVPFHKWNRFQSKVLVPIQSAKQSNISVTIEFNPKEGQGEQMVSGVNKALKDLGLDSTVKER
jgi:hypothetical protein